MSYGLIIWDIPLIKRSARNELLSILACIILGMIIGKILIGVALTCIDGTAYTII